MQSRPNGIPQAEHFAIRSSGLPALAAGQILVRNRFLSVDPAMRGWICDSGGYLPQLAVGETVRAFAVGEVVASQHAKFQVGDRLMGMFGWQDYAVADDTRVLIKIESTDLPLSLYLGVLGLNGLTAYFGLLEIGQPRPGDSILVSTAAGSVGSCVGQIAKLSGCRTVGIAGGAAKVRQCIQEFSYDAAIDYKSVNDLDTAIAAACPDGVDVYYDNTSGPISDAAMRNLRIGARVVICGTAAYPSWNPWNTGPRPERHLLIKRARMHGFIVTDFQSRFPQALTALEGWVRRGSIRYSEEFLDGIDQAPGAIAKLYRGENSGKLLIRLSPQADFG